MNVASVAHCMTTKMKRLGVVATAKHPVSEIVWGMEGAKSAALAPVVNVPKKPTLEAYLLTLKTTWGFEAAAVGAYSHVHGTL